jgi:hypothetical protein
VCAAKPGQDGRVTTQEQRWATAERSLDVQSARRIRRTPAVVIAILGLLVLAVGLTAAVDLRRLQTPRGAALAWTEAAVFGNCHAYLSLSRAGSDPRTDEQVCAQLRRDTASARSHSERYSFRVTDVQRRGPTATVSIELRQPSGVRVVNLQLVRRGRRWEALRASEPPLR